MEPNSNAPEMKIFGNIRSDITILIRTKNQMNFKRSLKLNMTPITRIGLRL